MYANLVMMSLCRKGLSCALMHARAALFADDVLVPNSGWPPGVCWCAFPFQSLQHYTKPVLILGQSGLIADQEKHAQNWSTAKHTRYHW